MPSAERGGHGALFVALGALLVAATCSRESRLETVSSAKRKPEPAAALPTPVAARSG